MSRTAIPLTQAEAFLRSSLIESSVNYRLFLCLRKGEVYQGYSEIKFLATEQILEEEGTFLEFAGKDIQSLIVNGQDLTESLDDIWEQNRIFLSNEFLNQGENFITVGYENNYNRDSFGFVSTHDIDGQQYIYIQTVPHYAHRIVPMFDQPNLKGTFEISVTIPGDWHSITTGDVVDTAPISEFFGTESYAEDKHYYTQGLNHFRTFGFLPIEDNFKITVHENTSLMATYLLNLVCGPFARFDLPEEERFDDIPMTIYCRESLAQFAEPEQGNMFDFQKAGIKFYNDFFQYKYPYTKLDMMFCPEFAWGAMEYPGAVTYAERLLPREENSDAHRNERGSIILHEIAHMWFGNLVTMHWWNDLWLNESFAEFICHLAFHHVREELDLKMTTVHPWVMFMGKKYRGYLQDSETSTHPISGEVPDTEAATTIFDGITYSKGASTLKCLLSLVGEENFSNAMGNYFNKFQFSNTVLDDLLECIQEQTDVDIVQWRDQWIQKAGYNYLLPQSLSFEDGRKSLLIKQGIVNELHPTLRYHAVKIAFFNEETEIVAVKDVLVPNKLEHTIDVTDVPEYTAVFMNYEDQDFIQTRLDKQSYDFFKANLTKFDYDLTQTLLLKAFYDSLVQGQTTIQEWNTIACDFVRAQTKEQLWEFAFHLILEALSRNTPSNVYKEIQQEIYDCYYDTIITLESKSDKQFILKEFIKYATSQEKTAFFVEWLFGDNEHLQGIEPTIAQSWNIAEMVNAYKDNYGEELAARSIEICSERDQTDTKLKYQLKITALGANEEERQALIEKYMSGDHDWSNGQLGDSISGFVSKFINKDIKRKYYDYFFDNLLESMRNQPQTKAKTIYYGLLPKNDSQEYCLQRLKELLEEVEEGEAFIRKALQASIDQFRVNLKNSTEQQINKLTKQNRVTVRNKRCCNLIQSN